MSKTILNENDIIVFRYLTTQWPDGVNRPQIVKDVDLPRTTIYDALKRLERKGYVTREPAKRTTKGRPPTIWWADPPIILPEMWSRVDQRRRTPK